MAELRRDIHYSLYRDFPKSLRDLKKQGGKYQKAAEKIHAIHSRIGLNEDPFQGVPLTNHGEKRIQHCIKYDLTGFCRLVTYQNQKSCILL